MESLTRSLARELGHKYNANVNCVGPGPANTKLWAQDIIDPEVLKPWNHTIQSTPAEVYNLAQIVPFLSEEGSRWVSGRMENAKGGCCSSISFSPI